MKTYEKPTFTLVNLSTNTAICACQIDAVGDNRNPIVDYPGGFGNEEDCTIVYDGYCKFTSEGKGPMFFNS